MICNRRATILNLSHTAARRKYILRTYFEHEGELSVRPYMVATVNTYPCLMQKSLPALIKAAAQKQWHCIVKILFKFSTTLDAH